MAGHAKSMAGEVAVILMSSKMMGFVLGVAKTLRTKWVNICSFLWRDLYEPSRFPVFWQGPSFVSQNYLNKIPSPSHVFYLGGGVVIVTHSHSWPDLYFENPQGGGCSSNFRSRELFPGSDMGKNWQWHIYGAIFGERAAPYKIWFPHSYIEESYP